MGYAPCLLRESEAGCGSRPGLGMVGWIAPIVLGWIAPSFNKYFGLDSPIHVLGRNTLGWI